MLNEEGPPPRRQSQEVRPPAGEPTGQAQHPSEADAELESHSRGGRPDEAEHGEVCGEPGHAEAPLLPRQPPGPGHFERGGL